MFSRFAERTGFEPANRFCRLHAFQACLFNHSSTSPNSIYDSDTMGFPLFADAKVMKKIQICKDVGAFLISVTVRTPSLTLKRTSAPAYSMPYMRCGSS